MADLQLQILTPQGIIFEQDIHALQVPAPEGEMGILPGHAPTLTYTALGILKATLLQGQEEILVENAFISIEPELVNIIAEFAAIHLKESAESINQRLEILHRQLDQLQEGKKGEKDIIRSKLSLFQSLLKK